MRQVLGIATDTAQIVFTSEQSGPGLDRYDWAVGAGVTAAMTTSREYRQFARKCTKWADETDTKEAREAFLDLARDWSFAALTVDRIGKEAMASVRRLPRTLHSTLRCPPIRSGARGSWHVPPARNNESLGLRPGSTGPFI
jgi:hypothetical protein